MVSENCLLDFRIFCLTCNPGCSGICEIPKGLCTRKENCCSFTNFQILDKGFFTCCAHMFGISVHSLISEIKYFTKTYICKSQSQSSTFHQKKYICKSQHQNSTYAGMAGVAEALFANAAIGARRVLKKEQKSNF